jgi:YbbR domain-containing protein
MAVAGFRHIGLKVISIALAAALWFIVSGEQIVERALRIPLELTNLPAQLEVVGDPPTVVDVRVRGSSGALGRIGSGELVAILDLRNAKAGDRLFQLTSADVRAPFGIEVVQVTPSSVPISFERSLTKVVPIVPALEGDPAPGYVVGTVTARPATVEVAGPASAVARVTEAITEPVSVAGAQRTITEMVTVGLSAPSVHLTSPLAATVTVNVTAAPVEWTVASVPIQVRNAGRSVQVTPTGIAVHVRGPRDARDVGASDFEAWIDVARRRPGQYDLPVHVVPPAHVGVVSVEPAMVRVRIK